MSLTGMSGITGMIGGGSGGTGGMSSPGSPSPWAVVGKVADAAGGFFPLQPEYSGDKGAITAGMDKAYDKVADTMMSIPGWGTIVGGAMKANALLTKGLKGTGAGTDGMTTVDAIMGSNWLGPIGWINGWTGKKADTMELNYDTIAKSGDSYSGTVANMKKAQHFSGKKYGGLSEGARLSANLTMHDAGYKQNLLTGIMDNQSINNTLAANQSDIAGTAYATQLNGGYNQSAMRAAKHGMKFTKEELFGKQAVEKATMILSKKKQGGTIEVTPFVFNMDALKDKVIELIELKLIEEFKQGGSIGEVNVIPEGALHKNKHHMEDVVPELDGLITSKGIPVVVEKEGGEVEQLAEIEHSEIILRKELTQLVEEAYKEYYLEDTTSERKDELAINIGKLLSVEIIENTDDRTNLIELV